MMNKRKVLILSVLAIFVVAMSLSAVSASKTKSTTVKIYKQMKWKNLHNNDGVLVVYNNYNEPQYGPGLSIYAEYGPGMTAKHLRLVKAKAYYKKNGKTIKKVRKSKDGYEIYFKLIKGHKPYKVKIYYKK